MDVLSHPNPALRLRCPDVDTETAEDLRSLIEAMAKAMYEAPGIGLAAPQIGVQKRVIIYDLDDERGLCVLINPRIVKRSEETEVDEEGCLSLPGIVVPVERSRSVVCEALDAEGRPVRIEASDLPARLLQHETDHLDGVLIIDRATPEERKAALKRYREILEGRRPADDESAG